MSECVLFHSKSASIPILIAMYGPHYRSNAVLVYPPPPEKDGVKLISPDLQRLDEGEFLNDSLIDFYMK